MGLASYGKPRVDFSKIIKFKDFWKIDKSFFVNQKTPFDHRYSKKFLNKFQTFKRLSTDKVNQSHKKFCSKYSRFN